MLSQLFTFGDCGQPLCLDGSINAENGHGDHYLPAVASGNLALISFIEDAIGKSVSSSPLSATSSGATFSIVGGIPVRSTNSAGPIFAEQSRTMGKGRVFVGFNVSGVNYTSLGGVSTDKITLNFVHQDVDPEGSLGEPVRENDLIRIDMNLDINVLVSSVFMTYGLTDFIDMGVAVPFVRTSIAGTSNAQIEPFGSTAIHFFDGSLDDPVLNGTSTVSGSAAGIGDVVGRLKVNLGQGSRYGAAILGDVRFATGNREELLGTGSTQIRALGIASAQFGDFTPHLNLGYLVRTGELQNDAILATVGFDERMASWATLAIELMSQWQVGDNKITLPGPIQFDEPFPREVPSTGVTVVRENLVQASGGAKFRVRGSTILLTNVIIPLTKAGLQPSVVWTAGLEFSF
ncbi:MAG: hypothetical protein JSW51_02290 [Gemmatimonadota bacterium]|nr:MAG: hypothetical protein JSW51_02290 [Gemmatimonadota bacterium]